MHIALVIYGSLTTLSGGYLYDRKLVEYLRAQGDTVRVISLPWRNYFAHLTDNIRFRLPTDLDLLIQDELNHPSLLWANSASRSYPVISLVHHLRSSEKRSALSNWFYRILERSYLNSVDGFIFNSVTTKRIVSELVTGTKPGIIAYPPTDRFGYPMVENEIISRVYEKGPLKLLFLGNVIPRKGLHTLIEAMKRNNFEAKLEVIGGLNVDLEYALEMQQMASAPDLISKIHFLGPLVEEELIASFRTAHALVVPSIYEGFGIVYLEGMAFGLPAIGTTAGAASEIITDGETGFLIQPDNVVQLADRLSILANDRDLLKQMSFNALKRYREQPAWIESAGQIRDFIQKMISGTALDTV